MALINTLRNKMGKVVVAFVAVAIFAFILADLLGSGSGLFNNDNQVGEIAGEDISLQEFQNFVQEREGFYQLQYNRQPSESERPTIRQQAWELLVTKYAFNKQYEEVGVEVTSDEVWDMMQGKNQDPSVKGFFTNPETGEFDRQLFLNFLNNYENQAPIYQNYWFMIKSNLKPARERLKYENLLLSTSYVTSAEAQREYNAQNDVAEVKYLYVPFYAIGDSAVSVTERQLQDYYNKHKEEYKAEHTRSLKYVTFPIIPSKADTAYVKEEMAELKKEFATTERDSVYAGANTDALTFFDKYHIGTLPAQLKANAGNLSKGDVRGPYLTSNGYVLYKISDIFEDTVSYAKASHILIKGEDDEAKAEAQRILNEIKGGASFEAMAREHGTDATASRGGDLGWFQSGRMVEEFENAVFNANEAGLLNNVVKTEFGYHIIRVDEPKTNTAYKIASIERSVMAGDETRNEAFRKADLFSSSSDDLESFMQLAQEDTLNVMTADKLKKNDRRIGVLGEARQVIQWLFRDASVGEVSEVFELDDQYTVAVMTDETEKGYQPLENVKTEITARVKNQLKGEQIINKLNGLSGSLEEMASKYGADANVYSSSDLKLNVNSLPNVGYDPKAVGRAFSLEKGQKTEPFASENGVLIIEMQNKTNAPEVADYSAYKNQLQQNVKNRTSFGITEAIKEYAQIEDQRYKFY
ncbi:SurA N-terminal domain-containing protein [Fulvivirga kasyanovii]|uniref:Periplasmic chaperone PpiD n=1 Tax=Fulvivirga kasyanovii TaxID=396812 RepID=A0ABW9RLZ2_9BACT|nr:peptidylprolyl isomerase [Fulvivirga kasyanovii]MTI25006.1 foldase [Fulvivirga kasyanovii]